MLLISCILFLKQRLKFMVITEFTIKDTRRKLMLILTRRSNESVVVGDDIKITVLGIKGNQVRLGIDAPKSIAVHREEIYKRIQGEAQKDK